MKLKLKLALSFLGIKIYYFTIEFFGIYILSSFYGIYYNIWVMQKIKILHYGDNIDREIYSKL